MITLYPGATYKIPIKLKINDTTIKDTDINTVEFAFDSLIKSYPDNDVTYDGEFFVVALSSEDTLSIPTYGERHIQANVHFKDGSVKPTACIAFAMEHSHFKSDGDSNE